MTKVSKEYFGFSRSEPRFAGREGALSVAGGGGSASANAGEVAAWTGADAVRLGSIVIANRIGREKYWVSQPSIAGRSLVSTRSRVNSLATARISRESCRVSGLVPWSQARVGWSECDQT